MADFGISVSGMAALNSQIEDLKKRASKAQVDKALVAGGNVFKKAIQERAPERSGSGSSTTALPPGALKEDIHVTVSAGSAQESHVSVGPGEKTLPVAMHVELGHSTVRKSKNGETKVGHVAAHPFIRPAYEAAKEEALKVIVDTLKAEVAAGAVEIVAEAAVAAVLLL